MNNYQVLYRDSVEYSYLVLFYLDLAKSPRTTPQTFYAFKNKSDSAAHGKAVIPKKVENIHGSDVYQRYLERGWLDVTRFDCSLPSSIRDWLVEQVENRNKKIAMTDAG